MPSRTPSGQRSNMLRDSVSLGKLVFILLVGFLLIVISFTVSFDWPENTNHFKRLIFLNRYFVDFFQLTALLVLLNCGHILLRYLAIVISFLFVGAYFIQSQSLSLSGTYLLPIALENSDHVSFLPLGSIITIALIWMFFLFLSWFLILRHIPKPQVSSSIVAALILIILSIAIKNDARWLDDKTLSERFDFYNSGQAGVLHKSPIGQLIRTYKQYLKYLSKQNFIAEQVSVLRMSEKTAEFVYENYDFFGKHNAEYPLMHKVSYQRSEILEEFGINLNTKKNIIIFFAEGVSSRIIQPYSNSFDGLTPNIASFAKHSIRIDNYKNHTFATYRGLGGQLCSLFPVGRLYKTTNYYCLGHALKERGYETHFMVSQRLDQTDLDLVTSKAGFDQVYGSEEILTTLSKQAKPGVDIIPDRQLIEGLINKLESRGKKEVSPFLIGLYNFETHTGIRLFEKEKPYIGTTSNPIKPNYVLDTFHNFDRVFGKFWNYFKESKFYDNTIVILTTDHATFHSRDYRELVENDEDYIPIFIDKIPLLIYHPDLKSAKSVDVKSATSIDFAPSILHLSGVREIKTPFLGRSFFSNIENRPYASIGGDAQQMWWQDDFQKWHLLNDDSEKGDNEITTNQKSQREFLKYVQSLEQANKLWLPAE